MHHLTSHMEEVLKVVRADGATLKNANAGVGQASTGNKD